MTAFTVDVYADTICPWCYVGKRALDSAIESHRARYPDDTFTLRWRPYMLYPNAKVSGKNPSPPLICSILLLLLSPYNLTDKTAYNKKDTLLLKFGPSAPQTLDRMQRAGAPYDLVFNWDGRTGSSRDSHKLILLAGDISPSTQDAFIHALFDGALCRGHDVSDRSSFLLPLAVIHGLGRDMQELEAYLDSEEASGRVEEEMRRAKKEVGVTAVPSFVVNGRWKVGGMQEPGVFIGVFERGRQE
ncbi:hypothetical protein OQA88_10177 [Cercophora sp. LCS_1]